MADVIENTTPTNVPAVIEGSAPQTPPAIEPTTPTTPVEPAPQGNPDQSGDGQQSSAVRDLIAQRKKRQQAEQEAAYWKGVAEGRSTTHPPVIDPQVQPPETTVVPPKQDDFERWEDYEAARDKYLLDAAEARLTKKFIEGQRQEHQTKIVRTFQERMEAAAEKDPTIIDLLNDNTLPCNQATGEYIQLSENGPELLRWLDRNRAEAKRIAALHPVLAVAEIGMIGDRLKNKPAPPPPPRVSAAPEPITTLTPAGSTEIDEDKTPIGDWIKKRNEQQFKRR